MTNPWNPPPEGQQPVPSAYGQAPPTYGQGPGYGPLGQVRSTPMVVLLAVVTLGIYVYVYNYKVHEEMKQHSGRGLGGGVALLLTFLAGVAMPFLTPNEVGNLYRGRGQKAPVTAWTGLWLVVPQVAGFFLMFVSLIAVAATADNETGVSNVSALGLGGAVFAFFALMLAGAIVWVVKTNGALNRYWEAART